MNIKAYAKINLSLDIVGKREDGYHLLDSIMQTVSLFDKVSVKKADTVLVSSSDEALCGEQNIAFNAANKFFEYTGISGGAEIYIEKNIPVAAGLGGGSADAAAVIRALNSIYSANLDTKTLCDIGLSCGADVPFLVCGGTARVTGIGENIEPLPFFSDCGIVLVKNAQKGSTKEMYQKMDAINIKTDYTAKCVEALSQNSFFSFASNCGNSFSKLFVSDQLISDFKNTNPFTVSLSGSGPTYFAIYKSKKEATVAANELSNKGYTPYVAKPVVY